ncbi:MAG: hypothetical protein IPJ26_16015 [Bacteroidetes bacterium]|nr:hypothetical protein [Bacteroidota bacterium]
MSTNKDEELDPNPENHENDEFEEEEECEDEDHPEEGHLVEEHLGGTHHRRKRKVKIRKRVRIKREDESKEESQENVSGNWVVIISVFIVAAIYLIVSLDLNSKHREKRSVSHQIPVPTSISDIKQYNS